MESAIQKNIAQLGSQMENALKIDASAFQNAIHMNMTQEELAELMKSSMLSSTSTYDGNLQSLATPTSMTPAPFPSTKGL